jgi:hypothetical protein
VLQWVRPNASVIDIPPDTGISSTFKVEDLVAYTSHTVIPDDPSKEPSPILNINPIDDPIQPSFPPAHKENIDAILDEQVLFARDGGVQRFLIRWRGRPDSYYTWIARDRLQYLDIIHGSTTRAARSHT